MRSITDVFIKHPVLAIVVNLALVLVGWRSIASLPIQQYPKLESSSVLITTVYTGASAETVITSYSIHYTKLYDAGDWRRRARAAVSCAVR